MCVSQFFEILKVIFCTEKEKRKRKMVSSSSSSPVLHSSSSLNRRRDQDYSCYDDEALCSSKRPKNDVFLNYSSQDVGKSFVSHLKAALQRNGFAISDHTMLPIGHDYETSELLKAIQDSEIYVVVLSPNYASSVKCLDELVLIMDSLIKFKKRRVFPIFFHVDPSHVRSQKGSFLEAFHRHDTDLDPERVQKWRHALQDLGQRSGQTLQNGVDEADILSRIVEELEKMQSPQDLHVIDHHVGLGSRVEELISELRLACDDILVVAVFGISGIGKTEIAKATYNRIATDFDVSCFLDIHDFCGNQNWKVQLQNELISCLTQNDKLQITHHNDRLAKIRNLTSRQKILLVLDDVDDFQQLEALGIDPARFYNGSRIIVTTRDKMSLGDIPHVCYHTKLLNRRESLNLFTRLMFSRDEPVDEQFVEEIVRRAGGLPLVLELWSRHFKCHERKQWPRLLEQLRRIPHKDVQKKLQVSYDSLSPTAKNLFLDIACFFDGMDTDLVIKVLQDEDNYIFADIEIQDLIDKGLLQDYPYQTRMHEVIREMGREVVRQENEDDPGQRSRLVGEKDVVRVLRDCSGTDSIRSICLYGLKEEEVTVQVEAFRKMSNLRFIKFSDTYYNWKLYLEWSSSNDEITSTFSFKRLKYLECSGFPFKCLDKFDMKNVVVIKLFKSKLEILWEGAFKSLKKLRILAVSNSSYLIRTGSFIGLENLEELDLSRCENLEELDGSIGCLQKLVTLNLWGCTRLKRVPWEMIGKLTSLVTLNLSHCPNILNISHELGNLKSLEELYLDTNSFPGLPDSVCQLHQLNEIELSGCDNLKSIPNLPPNTRHFQAGGCGSLESLPDSLCQLHQLSQIELSGCDNLKSIPNLPGNIPHFQAGSCSSPVPYSSSSSYKRPKHDLFLSYSNEDIVKSFVSRLKGALQRNGFDISDNTSLLVGQDESSELLKAIEDSGIYVVVFSSKYPFSVKCLDELVLIVESISKFKKRRVFPIFFKVDPFQIRNQAEGSFLEAFRRHDTDIDPERVQKWRDALQDLGQRSGQTLQNGVDEADILLRIVEELEKMQSPQDLHVTDHHVGLGSRAEELISKLRLDCEDVLVVAVFGISGIGKTAVVKATYNRIATDFDVSCFLADIHYYCGKHNWKVKLQKKLISSLTQNDKPPITRHNDGLTKIRKLISRLKILLVLDDVDNFQQLEALGIDPSWFYNGSRIIVTTRDKMSLGNIPYVCYHTELLNRRESLNLFTRLMFSRDDHVDKQFVEEIVRRAGGLPLVLEVWSRHFKCHERKQWPIILEKLIRIPHEDVQQKLQVSYYSLSQPRAKNLFLDIACFFDGMGKDLVIKVLEDEDKAFFPDIEIQDLIDKALLQDSSFELRMHEVIREMGREVVRQENEDDPGQRSRLVTKKDVVRVLRDCSGTDSVRSIYLGSNDLDEDVTHVQVEAFRKMSNLRFIKLPRWQKFNLQWCCSNDDVSTFSFKHLKYMEWNGFPFECLDKFDMVNIVVIKLYKSELEIIWEGAFKSLKKLRILAMSCSSNLTRTGSFIGLENLEELRLDGCRNLEELDGSIGCLQKLVILDLNGCRQLKRVPWEMIGKLTSLVTLDLRHCPNILNISYELGNLKGLNYLNLERTCKELGSEELGNLKSLPSNMSELKFLTMLVLDNCKQLGSEGFVKVTGLRNLRWLSMINCNVSQVSSEVGNLASLEYLNLSENAFPSLHDSISNLSRLEFLKINDCHKLKLLPLLPSKLSIIEAYGCWSLDVMPFDSRQMGYIFRSQWWRQLLVNSQLESRRLIINLSGKEEAVIPEWCSYRISGKELCFVAPTTTSQLDKKIYGVIFYCNTDCASPIAITMLNKTKETRHRFILWAGFGRPSVCMGLYPLNDETLVVQAGDTLLVKYNEVSRCGLSLIYADDVVDNSTIFIKDVNGIEPPTTLNDEVCIFHTNDEERKKCVLLLPHVINKAIICAKGVLCIGSETLHGSPILDGYAKVQLDHVEQGYESFDLPVPNDEHSKLEDAIGSFIQWPKLAISILKPSSRPSPTPGQRDVGPSSSKHSTSRIPVNRICSDASPSSGPSPTYPLENQESQEFESGTYSTRIVSRPKFIQDYYYRLMRRSHPGLSVSHDIRPETFSSPAPLHVNITPMEVMNLLTKQQLEMTILAVFVSVLHNSFDIYFVPNRCAFLNPFGVNATMCQNNSMMVENHLREVLSQPNTDNYLLPYHQWGHWTLFILRPNELTGFILDSVLTKEKTKDHYQLSSIVEKLFPGFRWIFSKVQQQESSWECGYYVMRWIYEFVKFQQQDFPAVNPWNDSRPYEHSQLDAMVCFWTGAIPIPDN